MVRKCSKFGRSAAGTKVCRKFSGVSKPKRAKKSGLSRTCTRYGRSKTGKKVCRKYA